MQLANALQQHHEYRRYDLHETILQHAVFAIHHERTAHGPFDADEAKGYGVIAVVSIFGMKGECQLFLAAEKFDDVVYEGGEDECFAEFLEGADVSRSAVCSIFISIQD